MTREEYEERRRRLDTELRAGIELLEQGHRRIPISYRRLPSVDDS